MADGVAGRWSISHLMEFKSLGGRSSKSQVAFQRTWTGCYHIATNLDEAVRLLRECEERIFLELLRRRQKPHLRALGPAGPEGCRRSVAGDVEDGGVGHEAVGTGLRAAVEPK